MKVIIVGGRYFDDYEKLRDFCDHMLSNISPSSIEIVSGVAKGDSLGDNVEYSLRYVLEELGHRVKIETIQEEDL